MMEEHFDQSEPPARRKHPTNVYYQAAVGTNRAFIPPLDTHCGNQVSAAQCFLEATSGLRSMFMTRQIDVVPCWSEHVSLVVRSAGTHVQPPAVISRAQEHHWYRCSPINGLELRKDVRSCEIQCCKLGGVGESGRR